MKANVECAALDPATGRNVPRSYVSHLEDRILALEHELATLKIASTSMGTPEPSAYQGATATAVAAASMSPLPRSPQSVDSAANGDKALSFAKMMFSAVHSPDATSLETPVNPLITPANLPSYKEMQNLLHIYFNHSCPQVPTTSYDQAKLYVQRTYFPHNSSTLSNEEKTAHYFIHIIAAIAYAKDPADTRSEQQHASAILYLPIVFKTGSRLTSLEAILLLTVYGTNRPSTPGIWYTLGIASRLITDLSLEAQNRSDLMSDLERRLFWSWYVLDRQICVYLSRPTAIADNVIHCPLPVLDPIPEAFCKLRIMQSEIQRILHHSDTLPREYVSLEQWRDSLNQRLENWNGMRPKTQEEAQSDFNLLFLTLNYEQTRLLLHGFSTNLPITTAIVLQCSKTIVEIYNALWIQDKVNFIWLAIHNTHIAASSFIYALLQSPHSTSTRITELNMMVARVGDMLTGMATRCPASLQILETFGALAQDVESRLSAPEPPIFNPHENESTTPAEINGTTIDSGFMEMIGGGSRNALWADFFAGDDFMF